MRETDTYGALIDQLTGGLADVSFRRHDDGTVKYEVSKNFRRKEPEPSKPKPSKSEPLKTELSKPQPPKAKEPEPVKPEPLKPVKTESSKPQPLKTELSKPLPLKAELLKTKQFEPSFKAIEIDPWTGSQITR